MKHISRMFFGKDISLLGQSNMCIDFSDMNGTVSKHFLYVADINIGFQQAGGKSVSEHMGCDMLFQVGQSGIMVNHEADGLVGQLMCQPVDKEIATDFDILSESFIIQP